MKIQCSECNSTYNINEDIIPDKGRKVKCPKCQNLIELFKPEFPILSVEELMENDQKDISRTEKEYEVNSKTKKCPYCAEEILIAAKKCKHCRSNLAENDSKSTYYKEVRVSKPIKKKYLIAIPVLCLLLIVGYVGTGPFITLHAIKTGIAERDSEKLAENIDFPTLRQNLKEQFNALLLSEAASELKDNPFTALAMGFASKLADGIVDSFVTPAMLARLMAGETSINTDQINSASPQVIGKDDLFKNARFNFDSTKKFSIWVPNDEDDEVRFLLTRNGLEWKLSNIILSKKWAYGVDSPLERQVIEKETIDPGVSGLSFNGVTGSFVQSTKAGQLFVIKGMVSNEYPKSRSFILVKGNILDEKGQVLKRKMAYAGNTIPEQELKSMTLDQINSQLKNRSGKGNINLNVEPKRAIPFMIILDNLPENLSEFNVEAVNSSPAH